MKYLSRPDLPTPIMRALVSDEYEDSLQEHFEELPDHIKHRFSHAISVTTLPRSSRQRILFKRHHDEVTIDPMKKFWAMGGRSIHSILEQNHDPEDHVEERLGIVYPVVLPDGTRADVYLHGCADIYKPSLERIDDYKWTSCGSLLYPKDEHAAQLNILRYIWRKNGRAVSELRNIYLLRDWNVRYYKEGGDYPMEPIVIRPVPIWTDEQCMSFIEGRLKAHFSNESRSDDELDYCTPAERWQSEPKYGVFKLDELGNPMTKAKHWSHSMTEAEDKIRELEDEDWGKIVAKNNELAKPKPESVIALKRAKFTIKEVPSSPRRCAYCEVASFCGQLRDEVLANQSVQTEPEIEL